jgi:hypothetical protein
LGRKLRRKRGEKKLRKKEGLKTLIFLSMFSIFNTEKKLTDKKGDNSEKIDAFLDEIEEIQNSFSSFTPDHGASSPRGENRCSPILIETGEKEVKNR